MCDFSIDETCDVWNESRPRARKEHVCSSCAGPIRPGETYLRVSMVFDGTGSTSKACPSCTEDYDAFRAEHTQWYEPGSLGVMLEECVEYAESEAEAEPWRRRLDSLRDRKRAARG